MTDCYCLINNREQLSDWLFDIDGILHRLVSLYLYKTYKDNYYVIDNKYNKYTIGIENRRIRVYKNNSMIPINEYKQTNGLIHKFNNLNIFDKSYIKYLYNSKFKKKFFIRKRTMIIKLLPIYNSITLLSNPSMHFTGKLLL
jgi:hypothetical protein